MALTLMIQCVLVAQPYSTEGEATQASDSLIHASEPILTSYDASGKYPQCSEGPESYVRDCLFPSDFFFYIPAHKPVIGPPGVSCADMNYSFVSKDPIFANMSYYWKVSNSSLFPKTIAEYFAQFNPKHPDMGSFLNFTRDHQKSCGTSESPLPQPRKPVPFDNDTAAYYDASGHLAQCSEGPYSYIQNCVVPSDYLAYTFAREPVVVKKTCAELGFVLIEPDPLFNFSLYWKGGPSAFKAFFADWGSGHPDFGQFVSAQRQANPSC